MTTARPNYSTDVTWQCDTILTPVSWHNLFWETIAASACSGERWCQEPTFNNQHDLLEFLKLELKAAVTPSPRTPAVPAGQHPSGYLSRYLHHLSIAAQLYKIFFLGLISCHHLFLEIRAGFMLKSVCMSEVPIKLESWMRTTKLSLIESGDDLDISTLERTQPVCLGCRHRYYSDTTAGRGGAGRGGGAVNIVHRASMKLGPRCSTG